MTETDAVIAAEKKFGSAEGWNEAGYVYFNNLLTTEPVVDAPVPTDKLLTQVVPVIHMDNSNPFATV